MRLVVDTNILFSFFRENPVREIIVEANQLGLKLFTPEYAFDELKKNQPDLMKYTKLKYAHEIAFTIETLRLFIETKSMDFFKEQKDKAEKITPDKKDAPFFALALQLKADLWSNEPRLKKQSIVEVITTKELRTLLNQ